MHCFFNLMSLSNFRGMWRWASTVWLIVVGAPVVVELFWRTEFCEDIAPWFWKGKGKV
jgi:hypothetical protein